ncbi:MULTISPECIES: formimidoylglutamase [unclassified Acinetobacter]|uniref:formimidoylglutamase n=1 Tax=unclassified Acinetobacter TaxID=196816 RepID=UPI0015D106D7|nr:MULTISPECIES: formimidoylglutamase [unclassified Acinetobacter]
MENNFIWTGRCDGSDPSQLRIHQIMNQSNCFDMVVPTFTLVGFCSDEGVNRNFGRVGAAEAPDLIRKQLASLPIVHEVALHDRGNISCLDGDLEQAQTHLSAELVDLLESGHAPIVLGGGHEVAYGSFKGLFDFVQKNEPHKTIGIINFDAHFDLRNHSVATSGTPFLQAAKLSQEFNQNFNYLCLGVARHSNTKELFSTADRLNCTYIYDNELRQPSSSQVLSTIKNFIDRVDILYVTVDLDVFSAAIAPGVSAPAVRGIDVACFDELFSFIHSSGKIRLLDIAECNPRYDIDQHTAKLAAYIIFNYIFK